MKKPAKPKKTPVTVPKTVPATVIAGFTGLTPQRVAQLAHEGVFPTPGKKGAFAFRECVAAYCERLRGKEAARPGAAAETRIKEANAVTAEVEAAKGVGLVMLKTDARVLWADGTIETRRAIEEAEYLSISQKAKLLDRLAKITLAE